MKVTSMWFWGPVIFIFGGVMALLWSAKPVQTDAGTFTSQPTALTASLDKLADEAKTGRNVASVTVKFRGPLALSKQERDYWGDKQGELWSFNRRLSAMIGFFHVRSGQEVKFGKVRCDNVDDAKLQTLRGKGAAIAASPAEFGCQSEDAREIGGKLPDDLQKNPAPTP